MSWWKRVCSTGSVATASSTPSGPQYTDWQSSPAKGPYAKSPTPCAIDSRSSPPHLSKRASHELDALPFNRLFVLASPRPLPFGRSRHQLALRCTSRQIVADELSLSGEQLLQ